MGRIELGHDEVMVTAKADLDNYFYRCRIARSYSEYFGMPSVSTEELLAAGASRDEIAKWTREKAPEGALVPCLEVLPMGFSHAPLMAQRAHEELLDRGGELPEKNRMREWRGHKEEREEVQGSGTRGHIGGRRFEVRWCHWSYIDDTAIHVIGPRRQAKAMQRWCDAKMDRAVEAYRRAGIPVKPEKVEAAELVMKVLGTIVDGEKGRVGVCSERRRSLAAAIRELLRRGWCTGRALACITGVR
jgi:hypothetical protein